MGELYQKYGVSANMVSCSYLYWQQETYCINDVIRERREFLGMTRSKLYQGVCSEKTMGRIERKQCNPQLEIVKELFERLQLSTELCHSVVVAERSEAISYSKQIRYAINNWDSSEKINKLIDEARQYISDKETVNRQFLEQCILVARRHEGSINEEEYMKGLKKIMGYTLPYQKMFEKRKGYITRQEQQLFYGICVVLDEKDKCEHLQILASFFEEQKNIPNSRIAMYDLVMTALASTLGNLKKYSESNILSHKVIQEMLKNRRIYSLALNIHNLMWNEESCMEEKDKAEFLKRKKKALKMCITLADLARQQYYEREFISELNELVNQ